MIAPSELYEVGSVTLRIAADKDGNISILRGHSRNLENVTAAVKKTNAVELRLSAILTSPNNYFIFQNRAEAEQ